MQGHECGPGRAVDMPVNSMATGRRPAGGQLGAMPGVQTQEVFGS